MNKKLAFLAAGLISTFTLAGVVVGTFSWFVTTVTVPVIDVSGKSASAYFAYGNGVPTEEGEGNRPYGISTPRHLYNLAWLQYTGFFADGQYYFELADSVPEEGLDMTGYILPPIGTEDNPFVGNFDGKGKIIKNLTVSNDQSTLFASTNRHPDPTQVSYTAPEVVGMFGVVGNLDDAYTGTYDTSINEIHDLGISDFTIESSTTKTLVGIAAGYVDATISNVAVNDSSIDIQADNPTYVSSTFTENLSDYGTVGYATEDYVKTIKYVDENLYDINITSDHEFNASDDGDSQGWGGSINMKTIYQRLYAIKTRAASGSAFTFRTNYKYYDDVENTSERVSRTMSNTYMYFYHGYNTANHTYLGNYVNLNRGTDYDEFMYLSGGHYEQKTYYTNSVHEGYRITDGTNYLTYNGSALGNTTTASSGTPWVFELISGSNYYIKYAYQSGSENRYLYNNNGTLTIGTGTSTNNNARWTVTKNGNNLTITSVSDTTKKIYYYGGNWTLITATGTESYYVLQSGSNYVSVNSNTGATVTNTTNESEAAHFQVNNNNYVYFQKSGSTTNYYLMAYRRNNSTIGLRVNTSTSGSYLYAFTYSGTTLSARYNNNTNYYVRYNYGWTVATSSYNITLTQKSTNWGNMYLSNTLDSNPVSVTGPDYYQTSANTTKSANDSHMYFDYSDTTYFPLNVNEDGGTFSSANALTTAINAGNFDPKDSNTGYITAGSEYSGVDQNINTTTLLTNNRDNISKVRISEYAISNISGSFSTSYNTLDKFVDSGIYTINASGSRQTMSAVYSENAYPRYKESKETFYSNALTTAYNTSTKTYTVADNVYGLHFMNTSIDMNTIVNARNVSILGNNADNYQLPVNAVDFNLKQKGVVNFFAGTYFSNNNSFFSLFEIFRNDDAVAKATEGEYTSYNTIRELKEIEEIYSNDQGTKTTKYSNIYKYKDKTGNEMYSVPYRVDGNQNKYVMNKNSDVETTTPYTYDTMNQTDFNAYAATYGYTSRFKTSQIGVNSLTSSALYYFEFPMNQGEYCLGSVSGGTGAYLLYLDIGANAAKTQRTVFYEHFSESVKGFDYPAGVAVIAVTTPSDNLAGGTELDETNTSNAVIYAGYKGILTISRSGNDVTLTRTGSLTAAKPTLVGELMWDDTYLQYNIHDPGGSNLSDEIVADVVTKDVRRLVYLDYNVNLDELMITMITDTSTDGGNTYERTYYQEYANGESTTDVEEMKVYNTNGGTRYSVEEIAALLTYLESVNNNVLITFTFTQEDSAAGTYEWVLGYDVDGEATGRYYIFSDYTFEITLTGDGSITFTVLTLGSKTIYIGDTEVTRAGQVITYPSA